VIRKFLVGLLPIAVLATAYVVSGRILVVKAVLPPNATGGQIARALIRPPYQLAAPHLSVRGIVRNSIFPVTHACSGNCTGLQPKQTCVDSCGFCGHCPDCVNGPCTVFTCQQTTATDTDCTFAWGTGPCLACRNDKYRTCRP
jgi:hypothetical protein